MLWEILILLIIIWWVQKQWLIRRQIVLARKLKTNLRQFPILGHSFMLLGSNEGRMRALEAFGRDAIEAGGISKIWMLNELHLCVADPVAAEVLLNRCLDKHEIMNVTHFFIGNGSVFAPVPIWRHRRKIIVKAFGSKNLIQYAKVFSEESIVMADLIQKEAGKGVFSFWDYIFAYSTDTICENSLGCKTNTQGVKNHSLLKAADELSHILASRLCQPWFHNDFLFQFMSCYAAAHKHKYTIRNYFMKIIKEKQKLNQTKNCNRTTSDEKPNEEISSFLDLQLEASDNAQKLNDTELLEEIIVLAVAGIDTTASSISFTVLMLGRHADIQEKIYEELQEVFRDSNRPVSTTDLPRLKYLEAVIKESLRLYPSVPVIIRKANRDVTLPSGLTVVKGCGILLNIWAVHRNPEYWGADADQFRPERFLNYTPKHPAAFIPFSYGHRGCIGYQYAMMSMKIMLSTLLRRYRVLPPPGVSKEEPIRTKFNVMMKDVDNFKIQIERRK